MLFKKANLEDFHRIKQFYWDLIDEMSDQNDKIGWKKGIYPTDSFLQESLDRGELFVLEEGGGLCASVILNSACNEGYEVESQIGHAPGGVCPFGINEGVNVYLDESLRQFDIVYPAAGDDHSAVKLSIEELEQISGAEGWVDVCKE